MTSRGAFFFAVAIVFLTSCVFLFLVEDAKQFQIGFGWS